MADDPDKKTDDDKDTKDLGGAGKQALDRERAARREAEKKAKDLADRISELEDKDKGDVERLKGQLAAAEKERDDLKPEVLRLRVAVAKGLNAAQAKRLVGDTEEELEKDADEILETFKPSDAKDDGEDEKDKRGNGGERRSSGGGRPIPDLKPGGGNDDAGNKGDVETDPAKLAAAVPRF